MPARPSEVSGEPSRRMSGSGAALSGTSLRTGASLTAVTLMLVVALCALNAVVPPLTVVSAVPPAVPVLRSQARKVRLGTPPRLLFQLAFGRKRTRHPV